MHWFILAALAMAAVWVLWYIQTFGKGESFRQPPDKEDGEYFRRWLEDPAVLRDLERAIGELVDLMSDPDLGGPGFLTLRLPQPGEDCAVSVTAQYPNIREVLYRCIASQTDLLAAGVPEALLALSPEFGTDSGGVVAVTVRAAVMDPKLAAGISGRTDRQEALSLLTDCLGRRFPALEVRVFGAELLLTPARAAV